MTGRVTTTRLLAMKQKDQKVAMLTAYDYPTARILDRAGVDVLLIGDSLGMVVLGYESTLSVTMDDMLHHTRPVARAAEHALVVADMPFMSYQASIADALRNAGRLLQEGGAHAVKLEGGKPVVETIHRLVEAGIPVMGHLGLTPQSVHALGGYRLQGNSAESSARIIAEADLLVAAGCFAIVLEMVPWQLAQTITKRVPVPTIGIGAGPYCDGQVLVIHDLAGLHHGRSPRFVRRYAELGTAMESAAGRYVSDVKDGSFPGLEHAYSMDQVVMEKLY